MRYLLDTNTCIDYLRHPHSKVKVRLQTHSPDEIALCTIVQAELYYGAWRSQNPAHNLSLLEEFFEPFASLPFCLKAAPGVRRDSRRLGKQRDANWSSRPDDCSDCTGEWADPNHQ
jgi:tRNA(fMet)-specific endonuclease VapC